MSDLRSDLDFHAVLLGEVLIPFFAALFDPLREGHTDQGVDHVADILAGHLADLLHDRKRLHHRCEG